MLGLLYKPCTLEMSYVEAESLEVEISALTCQSRTEDDTQEVLAARTLPTDLSVANQATTTASSTPVVIEDRATRLPRDRPSLAAAAPPRKRRRFRSRNVEPIPH